MFSKYYIFGTNYSTRTDAIHGVCLVVFIEYRKLKCIMNAQSTHITKKKILYYYIYNRMFTITV